MYTAHQYTYIPFKIIFQERKFVGGSQQISKRIAEKLGSGAYVKDYRQIYDPNVEGLCRNISYILKNTVCRYFQTESS